MSLASGCKLGPYEILSAIGSGGMGEVWKAHDTRLGRIVAIKKVKEQHGERFKQEARSIASLNHPNICQIHDIGDNYLVLEYVEGNPLPCPVPEQEAVRLAIQIVAALNEAHQHGIIHRDLKPSNILVTGKGSVKLLDFGLAKLYEQDQSISHMTTEDVPATQPGAILGTVAYMSPEQAQGQPVDARSDIFSFGLVLYEMLSGRRAFSGNSSYALLESIVRKEPSPLRASPSLEKIVKRCLEKHPPDRYQTMAELKAALEGQAKPKVAGSEKHPPSIAVLPFADMSPARDNEWFSDGLSEEIINALTKLPGLKVIARTSAFAFKGNEQDIRRIAEALNVSNILEGSVRKSGNRIRVTAQLINALDGSHLWSERYDRDMTDVFAIQEEISQAIADKLRVEMISGASLRKRKPKNIEAYSLYLKAVHQLYPLIPESLVKSREYFERAIKIDPEYAPAWAGLAHAYFMSNTIGVMPPGIAAAQFRKSALKALELDPMLPEAHTEMGNVFAIEFNWKEAEREFRRALDLNPEALIGLLDYGYSCLDPLRRWDEAMEILQKAAEVDPVSLLGQFQIGRHYYFLGQYARAVKQLNTTLEFGPNYYLAYIFLALSYIETGEKDKAIQAAQAASRITTTPFVQMFLAYIYSLTGKIEETERMLEEFEKAAQQTHIPAIVFAGIYFALGKIDESIGWLEKAYDEKHALIVHFTLPPFFQQFRPHPRYQALLRKMNLEP